MQVNCKRDASGTLYSEPTVRIEAAQYLKLEGKKKTVFFNIHFCKPLGRCSREGSVQESIFFNCSTMLKCLKNISPRKETLRF